jgi:O-antigen/teichoic acid export membrane protein
MTGRHAGGHSETASRPLSPAVPSRVLDATANESPTSAAPPVNPDLVRAEEVPGAKKVGRNIVEILVFRGLSTPIALLLVVVQGRFLAPEGRGVFVLAVLTVTIFSRLLSQLGVAVANHMKETRYDEPHEVRELVHRALGLAVLLGALGGAVIVAIGAATAAIGAGTALIAALALVPNVIWQTKSGVLLGLARIRAWNYVQLAPPLLALVGTLVLVVGLDGGVRSALAAWTAAHLVTAALALGLTRDVWLPVQVRALTDRPARVLLRLALAMGAMQVIALVSYRAELVVLEQLEDVAAVGRYSIAMQAAEALWLVGAAIATAITAPVIHEDERDAVALVRRSVLRTLAFTGGIAAGLAVVAPFGIPLVFGDDFRGASTPLLLLLPGVVLYAPVQVLVVYLSVRRGRPRLSLVAAATALAVTVASSIPLIAAHGAPGAAVASSVGYAAGALVAWTFFRRVATG